MPWTPAYAVINSRAIADNLLAYFITNQADALIWAGGPALRSFQTIANSIADRTTPVFPAIAFSDDNDAADYTGDMTEGAYAVTFDVFIQNANPSTAISEARVYAKAITSMIRNCPLSAVAANTGAIAAATVLDSIEIGFDAIKTNETQTDFMQMFQVKATYRLTAGAI